MPTNLGLDDEIATLRSQTRFIGGVRALLTLMRRVVRERIFGDVAGVDTGTTDGRAPLLGAGGRLPTTLTPSIRAGLVTSGQFGNAQIPAGHVGRYTGLVPSARISGLDVSKLSGMVPLARIPAGARASGRRGIDAVANATREEMQMDEAQFNIWQGRPKLDFEVAQSGGTLTVTLVSTVYQGPAQDCAGACSGCGGCACGCSACAACAACSGTDCGGGCSPSCGGCSGGNCG